MNALKSWRRYPTRLLTPRPSRSAPQHAVYGSFSAPKSQEVVLSRGSNVLELVRPDEQGVLKTLCSTNVFGNIRSLQPFRFPGSHEDYIIVGSESGRIVILKVVGSSSGRDAAPSAYRFQKVHQETYGRSGNRRIVPGEYLAVDPKGRACMVGALEKQKFVYVLNRDTDAQLTISSPLEAHKSYHVVYDIVGMDMGFENPQFAAIELDYGEVDLDPSGEAADEAMKQLVVYELDLGLNSVTRKSSVDIDNGASKLIAVPGIADNGPGGLLVCCENYIIYRSGDSDQAVELRTAIPRRAELPLDRGVLVTASAMLKQKNRFFTFVQTEHGDLFKVSLEHDGAEVSELKVKYFDTIPPATSMCIFRKGFLFAASEFGDHHLYQFLGLGDDDAVESSSVEVKLENGGYDVGSLAMDIDGITGQVTFEPRFPMVNLDKIDTMPSLAPTLDMKIANLLGEESPQIFCACGRGAQSTVRMLRPGLQVNELADSELQGNPISVFTMKRDPSDQHMSYGVVSFSNASMVLKMGESIEPTDETGFNDKVQTIGASCMHDGTFVQITPTGIRHVQEKGRVSEWDAGKRNITRAAINERQAAVSLAGGEVVYFEMTPQGNLVETERKELGGDVSALSIGEIPDGLLRSRYLAVGSYDKTVRLLSLDPEDGMKSLNMQALTETPESILLLDESESKGSLQLHIGLANGLLQRTDVDRVTGQMTDTRTRFLGAKQPNLCKIFVNGNPAMLALSTRPWLGYSDQGAYSVVPMSCGSLSHAAPFSSPMCEEGFIAVSKNVLKILSIDRLGQVFNERSIALRCTPRAMAVHPETGSLVVVESDAMTQPLGRSDGANGTADMDTDGGPSAAERLRHVGDYSGEEGEWGSCIHVIDPKTLGALSRLDLDDNEAAISAAIVPFESHPDKGSVLCVGVTKGLTFYPRKTEGNSIKCYEFSKDGKTLSLIHSTDVDAIPRVLVEFKGKLLAGVGSAVRILDLGMKRLLRKCEYGPLPTDVATLATTGFRIYVGDARESVHFMKYKKAENKLYVFADDSIPRHITAVCPLDYDTVAAADRFGNFTVLRLPAEMSAAVEEDPTAGNLSPNKFQSIANYYVGDTITSIERATMQSHGKEILIYTTINGAVGAFIPLSSKDSVDFFQQLEMHMRQEAPSLVGRDHLAYRSSYMPVRSVVDGDLCVMFGGLANDVQKSVSSELDRTAAEVAKKVEEVLGLVL